MFLEIFFMKWDRESVSFQLIFLIVLDVSRLCMLWKCTLHCIEKIIRGGARSANLGLKPKKNWRIMDRVKRKQRTYARNVEKVWVLRVILKDTLRRFICDRELRSSQFFAKAIIIMCFYSWSMILLWARSCKF